MITFEEAFAILKLPMTATKAQVTLGIKQLWGKEESQEVRKLLAEMTALFYSYFKLLEQRRKPARNQNSFFSDDPTERLKLFRIVEKSFADRPNQIKIFKNHIEYLATKDTENEHFDVEPLSFDDIYKHLSNFNLIGASIADQSIVCKLITEYSYTDISTEEGYKLVSVGLRYIGLFSVEFQTDAKFHDYIRDLAWCLLFTLFDFSKMVDLSIVHSPHYQKFYELFREIPEEHPTESRRSILCGLLLLNGLYGKSDDLDRIEYLNQAIEIFAQDEEFDRCMLDCLTEVFSRAFKELSHLYANNSNRLMSKFYASYVANNCEGMKDICQEIPTHEIDLLSNALEAFKSLEEKNESFQDKEMIKTFNSCLDILHARSNSLVPLN